MTAKIEEAFRQQQARIALQPLTSLIVLLLLAMGWGMTIRLYEKKIDNLELDRQTGQIALLAQSVVTARLDTEIDTLRPEKYSLLIDPQYDKVWDSVTRVEAELPYAGPIREELVVRRTQAGGREITVSRPYIEQFAWIRVFAPTILPDKPHTVTFTWYDPPFIDLPTIQSMRLVEID